MENKCKQVPVVFQALLGVSSPTHCSKQGELLQVARGCGQLGLNIFKCGDSATSLGNVYQRSVTIYFFS